MMMMRVVAGNCGQADLTLTHGTIQAVYSDITRHTSNFNIICNCNTIVIVLLILSLVDLCVGCYMSVV